MISRLCVRNFRRVADAEVVLGADDHLIAIEGPNGAGKSSLVEAMTWALTGESRYGRRGFDQLVRKGAELEGCEVVVEFNHAGACWRVERSRTDHVTRAVLSCDGEPVCDTPSAVDAEMARLLGMDAAGFKLAVLARQRDLAGLTSMSARARKSSLARLLGVEAIARAAGRAHEEMTRTNDVLAAMGRQPDVEGAKLVLQGAQEALQATLGEHQRTAQRLTTLEAELAKGCEAEKLWQQRTEAATLAEGRLQDATAALRVAEAELVQAQKNVAAIVVPEAHRDIEEIFDELRSIEAAEAELSTAQAIRAERKATSNDLHEAEERLAEAKGRSEQLQVVIDAAVGGITRDAVIEAGRAARAAANEASQAGAVARAQCEADEASLASLRDLEGRCGTCGQEVDEHHREELICATEAHRDELRRHGEELEAAAVKANKQLDEARDELQRVDAQTQEVAGATQELQRLGSEITTLERRIDSYRTRLARKVDQPNYDPAALTARKGELNTELGLTRQAQKDRQEAAEATTALKVAQTQHERCGDTVTAAEQTAAGCEISSEMTGAHERYLEAVAQQGSEQALLAVLEERVTAAEIKVKDSTRTLEEVTAFSERWTERRDKARVAARSKAILWEVHDELSGGLRPALQSAVAEMVTRLSDSRFAEVRVSDSYEVTVKDRTAWRELSELSGGEQDLVALAVRLGLSQVVSERALGAAPSLLVLDEVFGSQDGLRRETIMGALRELRSQWNQVWLISHVGGLAEVADRVVELSVVDDNDIPGEARSDITIL